MAGLDLKYMAAEAAIDLVKDGMKLGLGTGSTAAKFVEQLGTKVAEGLDVLCVPTSEATRAQAESLHIPLTTLEETPFLDMTIDGADEISPELFLIKGGGGALLREKIVATSSERMVVIADESKVVDYLGSFPLPVEVVQFGLQSTTDMLKQLALELGLEGDLILRGGIDDPFVTDEGHFILDGHFGVIDDPEAVNDNFLLVPGVVETGLFIDIADTVIIAGAAGVQIINAEDDPGMV